MKLFTRASIAMLLFLLPSLALAQAAGPVRGFATTTANTATTLIAASGGSTLKTYLTTLWCWRNDAGTSSVTITLNDSVSSEFILPNGGTEFFINFSTVQLVTAANTALTYTVSSATSTVGCGGAGNYGP